MKRSNLWRPAIYDMMATVHERFLRTDLFSKMNMKGSDDVPH